MYEYSYWDGVESVSKYLLILVVVPPLNILVVTAVKNAAEVWLLIYKKKNQQQVEAVKNGLDLLFFEKVFII